MRSMGIQKGEDSELMDFGKFYLSTVLADLEKENEVPIDCPSPSILAKSVCCDSGKEHNNP